MSQLVLFLILVLAIAESIAFRNLYVEHAELNEKYTQTKKLNKEQVSNRELYIDKLETTVDEANFKNKQLENQVNTLRSELEAWRNGNISSSDSYVYTPQQ